MTKRILKTLNAIFLVFFIVYSTQFSGISLIKASQIRTIDSEEKTIGNAIQRSNETRDRSKESTGPDLGDDQAFPFIPGFGENSGKD